MMPLRRVAHPLLLPLLLLLVLLGLSCPARAQDFYSGTDVVELSASSFRSKVLEDEHIWMIEFYAPWCGHCQRLKPDYIKAAAASKGIVRFGAINCDEHKSIAGEYGVQGFPTLKLFGTNKKRPGDYNGARSPKAMADAAIALLPNHVTVVTAKSHEEFLMKNEKLPKALLFTSKPTTTALYKALALDLKGRMALGEIRAKKDASLLSTYGVEESQLPVLLVLPKQGGEGKGKGEGEEGEGKGEAASSSSSTEKPRYEGELKHKPLIKFLKQYALPKPGQGAKEEPAKSKDTAGTSRGGGSSGSSGGGGGGSADKSAEKAVEKAVVWELASAGDVESKCLKGKGFCIIALLPALAASDAGTDTGRAQKVQALAALAEKYRKDPLRFAWMDLGKVPAARATFLGAEAEAEVEGQTEPALVLLSPKRDKFSVHWGFEGLDALLDRAIGGDISLASKVEEGWHKSVGFA